MLRNIIIHNFRCKGSKFCNEFADSLCRLRIFAFTCDAEIAYCSVCNGCVCSVNIKNYRNSAGKLAFIVILCAVCAGFGSAISESSVAVIGAIIIGISIIIVAKQPVKQCGNNGVQIPAELADTCCASAALC